MDRPKRDHEHIETHALHIEGLDRNATAAIFVDTVELAAVHGVGAAIVDTTLPRPRLFDMAATFCAMNPDYVFEVFPSKTTPGAFVLVCYRHPTTLPEVK